MAVGRVQAYLGGLRDSPRFVRLVLHVVPALHQAAARDGDRRDQGGHPAGDEASAHDRFAGQGARRHGESDDEPAAVGGCPLMQGVLGVFHEIDSAVHAIEDLTRARVGPLTVFSPTPRHEFEHVLARPKSAVRKFTLAFGLMGVTFGYWIAIWISDYWPLQVGGKPVASWVPYTIIGFEVMVLVGGLATVFAMFALSRIPRLTMTVGYDERFSHGDFGVWVVTDPNRTDSAMDILKKHGAEEVRRER